MRKDYEQEFNKIYTELSPPAHNYVGALIRDPQDAKEIISNAFIKLWSNFHLFKDPAHIRMWLFRTLHVLAADHYRRDKVIQISKTNYAFYNSAYEDPYHFADNEHLFKELEKQINRLTEKSRLIINLRFNEGMSINSIADKLGMSKAEVYVKIHRATNLLKRELFKKESFEEPVQKSSETNTQKGASHLCIRINQGRLEVTVQQPDGTWLLSDGTTQMATGLFIFSHSKWSAILRELEKLINKTGLREQELQTFFESYPDLLTGDDYSHSIPQATIVKDDSITWKADFVLVPSDQLSFSKILELKLPSTKISLKERSGHHNYSQQLLNAIRQLQDYHTAFDSERTKQKFKEKYQTDVFKPDLQLVIGRRGDIHNSTDFLQLQRNSLLNLNVKDWDSFYEQLKKKYK